MKTILTLLLLAGSALAVNAQDWNSSRDPILTKSFKGESISEVRVETSGGNLSVEGTEEEPHVEVYVSPSGNHLWSSKRQDGKLSKDELQKRLEEEYELTTTVNDHILTVVAKPRDKFLHLNRSLSVSFRVYSPHKVSSGLKTGGGNISLSGLMGNRQDFQTSGGNLSIEQVSGAITGRTSGGNISIRDANPGTREPIDLSTSGGNITAEHCRGVTIHISTSGGNLNLRDLEGSVTAGTSGGSVDGQTIKGDLSAHTSGGNVHMDGLSGSLETSTKGGNIDVSMTALGKFVRIQNAKGNTVLKMPGTQGLDLEIHGEQISTTTLNNFKGNISKRHIGGSLNGGGIPVTIEGKKGDIRLTLL